MHRVRDRVALARASPGPSFARPKDDEGSPDLRRCAACRRMTKNGGDAFCSPSPSSPRFFPRRHRVCGFLPAAVQGGGRLAPMRPRPSHPRTRRPPGVRARAGAPPEAAGRFQTIQTIQTRFSSESLHARPAAAGRFQTIQTIQTRFSSEPVPSRPGRGRVRGAVARLAEPRGLSAHRAKARA